jgi:hypothetical protein
MPENIASQQQSAKHLAARAIMAYRAGFPVALLSVTSSSEHPSGIVCDWKGQRDSFHNDAKLLGRAFAFVYVGSIVDQAISDSISDELRKELVSDMSSALDARQTAVDWGVAKAVTDTNPFAHTGYKLGLAASADGSTADRISRSRVDVPRHDWRRRSEGVVGRQCKPAQFR